MKIKHNLLSVLALIFVLMFAVSCAPARRPNTNMPSPTPGTRQTRMVPGTTTAPRTRVPNVSPGPVAPNTVVPNTTTGPNTTGTGTGMNGGDMTERAKKIADVAARQKEVQSATCVITGNMAMVGLQFNEQYKGKMTDAIKKQVENRVRDTDSNVDRVVVTADPDMVSRIEDIFKDIGNGKPITGFTEELTEMINRISPK